MLRFLDEEPELARLFLLQSASAGPAGLQRRSELMEQLARVVDEGRTHARRQPPPLTAEGVVGGVLNVVTGRLLSSDPMADLVNPLMSAIVLPYRGDTAARDESRRAPAEVVTPVTRPSRDALQGLELRLTARTTTVLAVMYDEPGLSNVRVGQRAGISDQAQISKLLARLSRLGLAENVGRGQQRGAASNRWHLTERGREVEQAIREAYRGFGRRPMRRSPGVVGVPAV